MGFKFTILKYQWIVVISDNLLPCASVWSSHRETSNRRWIFLPFHYGWWSLHPADTHDLINVGLQQHTAKQETHWSAQVIPGTWTEGSPCGKLTPCNQNPVLLCREHGSSLKGGEVDQNQCISLTTQHIWFQTFYVYHGGKIMECLSYGFAACYIIDMII